jgi:hypothetical protein
MMERRGESLAFLAAAGALGAVVAAAAYLRHRSEERAAHAPASAVGRGGPASFLSPRSPGALGKAQVDAPAVAADIPVDVAAPSLEGRPHLKRQASKYDPWVISEGERAANPHGVRARDVAAAGCPCLHTLLFFLLPPPPPPGDRHYELGTTRALEGMAISQLLLLEVPRLQVRALGPGRGRHVHPVIFQRRRLAPWLRPHAHRDPAVCYRSYTVALAGRVRGGRQEPAQRAPGGDDRRRRGAVPGGAGREVRWR